MYVEFMCTIAYLLGLWLSKRLQLHFLEGCERLAQLGEELALISVQN